MVTRVHCELTSQYRGQTTHPSGRGVSYALGGRVRGGQANLRRTVQAGFIIVQITTDGHKAYLKAVENAFGADADYAQVQKNLPRSLRKLHALFAAVCIGCDMRVVSGNPDPKNVSTS